MDKAIIFDFDGVIVETEPLHCEAFQSVLPTVAIQLSRDTYFNRYVGLSDAEIVKRMVVDFKIDLSDDEIRRLRKQKDSAYRAIVARGIVPLPGLADFIRRVSDGWLLSICSGSSRREIDAILQRLGLAGAFGLIVSADDVSASKPDPEGFLSACEQLRSIRGDLTAERCVVIEDSQAGIAAARAAGMPVAAIHKAYGRTPDPPADLTIQDFNDLTDRRLGKLLERTPP